MRAGKVANRGVALVTVLIFISLIMPALVIILAFVRNEGIFPVQSWAGEQAEELAASGHQEAEWTVLGPWAAVTGVGRLDTVRYPQDRDADGLEDYDGDARYDEWGTALPFISIDHLSSPWISFPHLEPPARTLAAATRPGGSLPMAPMVGDYNRDGVVDYLSGEAFNPANPCLAGGAYAPCLSFAFMPVGRRDIVYPDSPPPFYAEEREFVTALGPLVYSAAAPVDPERLLGTTFVSDWYAADSVLGDRFAEETYNDLRGSGVVNASPYADRIKPLTPFNAATDSWDGCDPDVDTLLARDLALASEGLDYPMTLEVPFDRESDRPGGPAMPDSHQLLDPGTCLPWNAAQSQGGGAAYEGVVSDEGSRFPLHDFVHNPDDPFFHNPILLETYANVSTIPTAVPESCLWARASGATASAARCSEAHLAQRGLLALVASGVGVGHAAAVLSYIGFHDVGDVATAGGNFPDEERSDFDGDGRADEVPRVWPANLAEVLDVTRVKLRDGTSAGGVDVNLNVDEWKPFQSTVTNWSSRGEGTTDGGVHCGLFPFGGTPTPGCADPNPDPAQSLRPTLPSTAWPQMRDPILRCLDKTVAYPLPYATTLAPPIDLAECLGWMPMLDFWQTPTGWPTGVTAGVFAEPVADLLLDEVLVDDWAALRPECATAFYNGASADPLADIDLWRSDTQAAEALWPEEFWLFVRCFWDPALTDQVEAKRADLETAFETLFDDGSPVTAAFPDIMGAQFPQTLSAKVAGHWVAWQYWLRYFDGGDCRDLAPDIDLSDAVAGVGQSLLAARHARYHGIGDMAISVGDAAGLQAYRASGASRPYAELRGPYWDPGDVGDNRNPGCPANTAAGDWPDLVKDVDVYAAGESPVTCTIGLDPAVRCLTMSVSITDFSVMPALYIPDAVPGVAAAPPYNGFRWDDTPPSVPPLGYADHDGRNRGLGGSELTRDDSLVMHLVGEVAFFDSPFATYFDDPELHEPCLFRPLTPPYFLDDDFPGLDADPWNDVPSTIQSATFANLFDGDPTTTLGGWFEADGRNEGNAGCAGLAAANDPATWRPLRVRGRVNINTAPHSVLLATFAKGCLLGLGNPGSGSFFSGDCQETDMTRLANSVLRYREWINLNPALPVGDPYQGSFAQWTFDTGHAAANPLEQYFLDIGLFNPFAGAMAGLTGVPDQDSWLEAHLAFAGKGGMLRAPFRTQSQILDVAFGYAGLALNDDPRNLLDLDRALAMPDISGNDDRPSAAALFARIDQDLAVGSEGYRVETRGRFGAANASRFSIIALLDNGINGGYAALAVESETSRGVSDPTGLFYSGYYR